MTAEGSKLLVNDQGLELAVLLIVILAVPGVGATIAFRHRQSPPFTDIGRRLQSTVQL